ncbi:MAG: hypothetical protein IKQ46_17805 [Bacteroidales bacterium]|nr:hypothetical protein [Bacteroidales bacterium]
MKNLKLFLVALAATTLVISSCKKEDENNEPTTNPYSQNKEKIIVSAPEVVFPKQYQYVGVVDKINFKWEKPSVKKILYAYDDAAKSYKETEQNFDYTLKYELCYSTDGKNFETSDKLTEPEFSKNVTLEKGQTYYYKINTYISYGNTKDSLIQKYDCKYKDDVEIPFYSTYEYKHHIGYFNEYFYAIIFWDEECSCDLIFYTVEKDENGEYKYTGEPRREVYPVGSKGSATTKNVNGYRLLDVMVGSKHVPGNRYVVKYELRGKYAESGVLHLQYVEDETKYIADGNFNIYPITDFMNNDRQCVIFPKNCKTQYNEDMFEYSESGRLKRYNPVTFQGRIVTYEDWSACAKELSEPQFNMYINQYLGMTFDKGETYPFMKNGEYVCFDNQMISWTNYESKNFNKNCCLVELLDNRDENFKYYNIK